MQYMVTTVLNGYTVSSVIDTVRATHPEHVCPVRLYQLVRCTMYIHLLRRPIGYPANGSPPH